VYSSSRVRSHLKAVAGPRSAGRWLAARDSGCLEYCRTPPPRMLTPPAPRTVPLTAELRISAPRREWNRLDCHERGVEAFESCEGGGDHAYTEPTIRFHGDAGARWRASGVLITLDFPIGDLRRTWPCTYGAQTGPYWEITFTRKLN
jgi:hypothetical protein